MWTYNKFNEYLGNKDSKPVPKVFGSPRYTTIERICDFAIAVRYHWTNVVILHSDNTFTLNTGGRYSSTTKNRINAFSPVKVFQRDYVWFLGDKTAFFDGVRVNENGSIIPTKTTKNTALVSSDIPDAPFYVCSNNRFLSNFTPDKKINTLILPCADSREAQKVMKHAQSRNDQTYVRICSTKPRLNTKTHYYSVHDRYDYCTWYS